MVKFGAPVAAISTMTRSLENPPKCLGSVSDAARAAMASSSSALSVIGTGLVLVDVKMLAVQKGSRSGGAVSNGKLRSSGWTLLSLSSIAQRVVKPAPRGSGMEQMASSTLDCGFWVSFRYECFRAGERKTSWFLSLTFPELWSPITAT